MVLDAVKTAGVGLECFALGVESLCEGIGDAVLVIDEQAAQRGFERLGDFLPWADCGFCGWGLMALRQRQGVEVVLRAHQARKLKGGTPRQWSCPATRRSEQ